MDKETNLININVIIADRPYPLKVAKGEEEGIRKAAKRINDKIKEFQLKYEAKDKQDYLAMSALMFTVEVIENELIKKNEMNSLSDKINRLYASLS